MAGDIVDCNDEIVEETSDTFKALVLPPKNQTNNKKLPNQPTRRGMMKLSRDEKPFSSTSTSSGNDDDATSTTYQADEYGSFSITDSSVSNMNASYNFFNSSFASLTSPFDTIGENEKVTVELSTSAKRFASLPNLDSQASLDMSHLNDSSSTLIRGSSSSKRFASLPILESSTATIHEHEGTSSSTTLGAGKNSDLNNRRQSQSSMNTNVSSTTSTATPVPPSTSSLFLQAENERLAKEVKRLKKQLLQVKKKHRMNKDNGTSKSYSHPNNPYYPEPEVGVLPSSSTSRQVECYEDFIAEMEKTIRNLRKANKTQKNRVRFLERACQQHGIDIANCSNAAESDAVGVVVEKRQHVSNDEETKEEIREVNAAVDSDSNSSIVIGGNPSIGNTAQTLGGMLGTSSSSYRRPKRNSYNSTNISSGHHNRGGSAHSTSSSTAGGWGHASAATSSSGDGGDGSYTCYDDIWEETLRGASDEEDEDDDIVAVVNAVTSATVTPKALATRKYRGIDAINVALNDHHSHHATNDITFKRLEGCVTKRKNVDMPVATTHKTIGIADPVFNNSYNSEANITTATNNTSRMSTQEALYPEGDPDGLDDGSIDLQLEDLVLSLGRQQRQENKNTAVSHLKRRTSRQSISISSLSSPGYSVNNSNSWFNLTLGGSSAYLDPNMSRLANTITKEEEAIKSPIKQSGNIVLSSATSPVSISANNNVPTKSSLKKSMEAIAVEGKTSTPPPSALEPLSPVVEGRSEDSRSRKNLLLFKRGKSKRSISMRNLRPTLLDGNNHKGNNNHSNQKQHKNGSLLSSFTRSLSARKLQA